MARRLVLGLERGILGQPAAQRRLPHAAAGRGLHDRRLGQERQNRLLAHGRGFGAVADSGFPLVCGRLGRGGIFTDMPCGAGGSVSQSQAAWSSNYRSGGWICCT